MIYLNDHEIKLDAQERLEPWDSYDRVIWLAMDWIKRCPVDPRNGLPWWLQYSCFWTDPLRPTIWPDNPAGKFAWATTTLLRYYPYSGDAVHIEVVRAMLDRLIAYHTPVGFVWGDVPYASAEPGTGVYFGARADGHFVTEPDKAAQAGRAYLDFYELTGERNYLEAALRVAETLRANQRPGDVAHSPWPFRVRVEDGEVVEEYTSHILPMVRLFSELERLGYSGFAGARKAAWDWIIQYPMQNGVWKGHFEDIRLDPENQNRYQLAPMETARFLLEQRKEVDPDWRAHVPALIEWVQQTLGAAPFFGAVAIHEQKFCYIAMGSHTARYASLCARWAEVSGDKDYGERAYRSFNWSTYLAHDDGIVLMGYDRPDYYNQCWFTDSYFDYVPHFLEGMAALPELAPATEDHVLRSSSVVQWVDYAPLRVRYRTFDARGVEKLRLTFKPRVVLAGDEVVPEVSVFSSEQPSWSYDPASGVTQVCHWANAVEINGR